MMHLTARFAVVTLVLIGSALFCGVLSGCRSTGPGPNPAIDPVREVDPFIGTGGHGHTYPGATVPFGMVQLSPDTRLTGWDGCSGYHYSDSYIYGFSHTHLSGTGVSDYGDVLLMPTVGSVVYNNGADGNIGYRSEFSHARENASPGYYRVVLDSGVRVELTATERVGVHRYTFPYGAGSNLIIDLAHRDPVIESSLEFVNDREVRGMRRSRQWAEDQHVYFVMRFSKPFVGCGAEIDGVEYGESVPHATTRPATTQPSEPATSRPTTAPSIRPRGALRGQSIRGHVRFTTAEREAIVVKVGISAVSVEGAIANLEEEVPGFDFDEVRLAARDKWDRELRRIEVVGGTPAQRTNFYTALYHSFLAPNLFCDVDGRYRGTDLNVHQGSHKHHTVFSLWDTFRATHPLFTLIQRERTVDFIRTMLAHYLDGGALPIWELAGNETGCMIGYHSVSVIADAHAKGIRDFDERLALEAMVARADEDIRGLPEYREMGFVPADGDGEAVSKTLEYAYNDWCIATLAESLGDQETAQRFMARAQSYQNLFDPETLFMRGKLNHRWTEPFDPREVNFQFTEANSWQYSLFAPHDIEGLMELLGGPTALSAWLDRLFAADSQTTGRDQADITGLIGQYAHGNEPSHHVAYLYNYAAEPWKTQERVRQILDTLYTPTPDGLSGNEDCGQMSSWYVLSSLGFYPVTPGSDEYAIGTPLFDHARLRFEDGRALDIRVRRESPGDFYVQSVALNGRAIERSALLHRDLIRGGELIFELGPKPNREWAASPELAPRSSVLASKSGTTRQVAVPFVATGDRAFRGSTEISFASAQLGTDILYSTDGGKNFARYETPFVIDEDTTVHAFAQHGPHRSQPIVARFRPIPHQYSIALATEYSPQYEAGGNDALIDLLRGGPNFRTGSWQGYWEVDVDATVDLGEVKRVERVSAGFLQEMRSWIWLPDSVTFSVSRDGKEFRTIETLEHDVDEREPEALVREFGVKVDDEIRYVRVVAKNKARCPDWHPGVGHPAWVFIDEITID